MSELNLDQIRQFIELKNKIRHVQLSQTLSASLFYLLKTVELEATAMLIAGEERRAMRLHDLFDQVHVSRPAISKCLKECESRGYVCRYNNEADKRYSYVVLTDQGTEALRCADEEMASALQWIRNQFDEQEKEQFRHLIGRLNNVLDDFEKKGRSLCCD